MSEHTDETTGGSMSDDGRLDQPTELEPRLQALSYRLHSLLGGGADNAQPETDAEEIGPAPDDVGIGFVSGEVADIGLVPDDDIFDLINRELGAA